MWLIPLFALQTSNRTAVSQVIKLAKKTPFSHFRGMKLPSHIYFGENTARRRTIGTGRADLSVGGRGMSGETGAACGKKSIQAHRSITHINARACTQMQKRKADNQRHYHKFSTPLLGIRVHSSMTKWFRPSSGMQVGYLKIRL